ncbi:MAG TPA: tetratricopeptide repeat protein, partial [Xanthomonadaceae bacterium]|nr:tetratricopeptide repeat protein [Xanthomonadaceae bacterium]
MASRSFFAELKRRNVLRAATFYAASAWLIVQIATQVFPFFEIPNWVVRWIVVAAVIGFPFAMLFSWFYEWTPHGIERESEVDPDESITIETGRRLDRWIIVVLGVAVVLLLANSFVMHHDPSSNVAASTRPPIPPIPDKSIAVLPLANESGDKDEQYFSDGLSEDLITALSQFSGLKVISRNSSFQFRDSKDDSKTIGAKLGVAHLLEGSVRHAGADVRISAELVNAVDGSTLWSEHYDSPYEDLFKLQDGITQAVATALKATLMAGAAAGSTSDHPPSGNLDAYTAYLQGKFYFGRNTEADYRKAIDFYTTATRLDPGYAQAYAGLSHALTVDAVQFLDAASAQQAYAQARVAANAALRLAPNLAMVHGAHGSLLLNADLDWTGAETDYRRALELAPNDDTTMANLGQLLAALGQPGRAIDLTQRALATDPLNARWYAWLCRFLVPLGQLDNAEQAIRKAIELRPEAAGYHELLTVIAIRRGDAKAALADAQQERQGPYQRIALALAQQIGSDRTASDTALQNLIGKDASSAAYQIAEVYALRKDSTQTFAWLDRAWANRDAGIQFLLYDPFLLR